MQPFAGAIIARVCQSVESFYSVQLFWLVAVAAEEKYCTQGDRRVLPYFQSKSERQKRFLQFKFCCRQMVTLYFRQCVLIAVESIQWLLLRVNQHNGATSY